MNFEIKNNEFINMTVKEMNALLSPKKPEIIYEAMAYSINAGGKRLRPVLMLATCEAECGESKKALEFACAMEMIHTYSLIHDDLPAMDNDDLRRGKPTCHKQFDEAIAILAGDALLNKAYEVMADKCSDGTEYVKAFQFIAKNAGTNGMIGGQVLDVISEGKAISASDLDFIHKNKTAALITASLVAGAIIGGATEERIEKYKKIGEYMGIAFQIKDDILDITGTSEVLGKPILSDEKNQKVTYVSLHSMEKAKKDYEMLSEKALKIISELSGENSFLYEYGKRLINRIN